MSEINEQLKRLKKSLETLDSYASEIGKAKESATSVVNAIKEVQISYSESIAEIYKEVSELVGSNKPLITQLEKLTDKLERVDFPIRLDKIDATVAGINQGVMNLQGKIDNLERDLREKINSISIFLVEQEKRTDEKFLSRQKEIRLNKYLLFGVVGLVLLSIIISII